MPGMPGCTTAAGVPLASATYTYPLAQRAATLWYHDHRMGFTGASVWRGLAGFHLVHDDEEDALPLPRGDAGPAADDRRPGVRRGRHAALPERRPEPAVTPGVDAALPGRRARRRHPGQRRAVAGGRGGPRRATGSGCSTRRTRAATGSRWIRRRPAAAGSCRSARDGGLLAGPRPHDAIELAPAERFDVIVDFGRYPPGTEVPLVNGFGSGSHRRGAAFRRRHGGQRDDTPRSRTRLPRSPRSTRRRRGHPRLPVPGYAGDHGLARSTGSRTARRTRSASPRLGTTEVWRLVTDFAPPDPPAPGPLPGARAQRPDRAGRRTTRAGRTPSTCSPPRRPGSSRGSTTTRAGSCSTATTSSTRTWR